MPSYGRTLFDVDEPPGARLLVLDLARFDEDARRMTVSVSMDQRTSSGENSRRKLQDVMADSPVDQHPPICVVGPINTADWP